MDAGSGKLLVSRGRGPVLVNNFKKVLTAVYIYCIYRHIQYMYTAIVVSGDEVDVGVCMEEYYD